MELAAFVAFISVSAVVIIVPGPDTAITVRNTLLGGRRVGIATGLGVSLGQLVWTLAASAGIAALLVASEPAFLAVKLIGAGYLILLGLHSLYSAWKARQEGRDPAAALPQRKPMSVRAGLAQGVLSDLSNPKMAVFFMALLPQFVPAGSTTFGWSALLGLVFCAMTFTWLAGYAFVLAKAGNLLRTPRVKRYLDAITGTVLVALGLRIAAERT
jgi:threonine/homoserine/homoserine lactone efflux protein